MFRHALAFVGVLSFFGLPAIAQNQLWIDQFGTSSWDDALAAAPDGAGGVYLVGDTYGDLGGPNAGGSDAWLARYDGAGAQLWVRQFGTSDYEQASVAAPDGAGGVYVGGSDQQGGWLARYDGAGSQVWIRQNDPTLGDTPAAAAPDGSGGVYLGSRDYVGMGYPIGILSRFDGGGTLLWTTGAGAPSGAVPDGSGGVYVGEYSVDPLNGWSVYWLARYDGSGNQLWATPGFSRYTDLSARASDGSGGVYVVGCTGFSVGGPNAGGWDAWFARYDSAGNKLWAQQLGTSGTDSAYAASEDGSGGVYVGGSTGGGLGGPNAGGGDAWLARYDSTGNQVWLQQFGSSEGEASVASAPDGLGGVYVGGSTRGSLGGPHAGATDVWLARYDAAGETYCTAGVTASGCTAQITSSGTPSRSSPNGFLVDVNSAEGSKDGIFFFSTSGRQANPWGSSSSYQCVAPPVRRTGLQVGVGTSGACDGCFQIDFNAWMAANPTKAPAVGVETNMQCWFRDPLNTSNQTTSMSGALEFFVNP